MERTLAILFLVTTWVSANLDLESCTLTSGPAEDDGLTCSLRTLHPDLDFENLTVSLPVTLESVSSLRLLCNDVLFFESSLGSDQLSRFTDLLDLRVERCKVKFLPSGSFAGLTHLKNLTINTGNSDWAARSLDLGPGALENLPSLRHLDLGFNQLWNLPDRMLCQVEYLASLNLTRNLLSDLDDLGLGTGGLRESVSPASCLPELRTLDLSYNSLRGLGARKLGGLKRLAELYVQQNWLEELDEEAFLGLGALKALNLSSNRLVSLPSRLFQPAKLLQTLDLRNNSLTSLAPDLLTGLNRLVQLDLSTNSLTSQWITVEAFRGLVRLVILNLSNNQLTHLTPSTFLDLYTLQILDLSHNLISSIADSTFSPMSNLHSLNLGRNKLKSLSPRMLDGLYVLHKLILDYNQLEGLDEGSLRNCTSLSDLGLVGNQLTSVPGALKGLQLLKTIDLGENRISALSNESFLGMGQLYGLRLVDNQLTEIPAGVCDPVTHLRVFNVAKNKISRVSSSAFLACPELRALRLDSNALQALPPALPPQLPNLLWLNVSENGIRLIDYASLPPSLQWLDVSHNQLAGLGGTGSSNTRLRVLEAAHNRLTSLDPASVPPSLDRLGLSHNRLAKIAPETFSRSAGLVRVDLVGNSLENLPLSALRLPPFPPPKVLPEFLLGGNPFLCDCEMEWLLRIGTLGASRQYPAILDLDAILCRLTYSRSAGRVPLPDMRGGDFLCPYTAHCFQTCQCCEFDACDCAMTCPANCTCYHGDTWTANVVDCAGGGHSGIPAALPMDSTAVYMDGNRIPVLRSHSFLGRKNLRTLYLNGSGIESISNKSFNSLVSLRALHLEANRLSVLHGYEFDHLGLLRELYLQDNRLSSISNATFLPLKSLEILRIDGNRLLLFPVWQLSLNPYLVEIGLGRNSWNCDCSFLHQLYGWVTDNSKKVIDLGGVQCVWNSTREPGPHLLDYNTTCGRSWALIQERFDLGSAFPLLLGLGSLLIVVLLSVGLVFLCRESVRLWVFGRFGVRLCTTEPVSDNDKAYDAYFIYSQKDEEWVTSGVAEELETSENYRLLLHYRDLLLADSGGLKEVMIGGGQSSRSIVVLLSRHFLEGEWGSTEFKAGVTALLKVNTSRPVILVLREEVPEGVMSSELRRTRLTQLRWTDPRFWSKFKLALPPPSSHYHSNITSQTTNSSAASSERAESGLKFYPGEPEPRLWPGTFVGLQPPKYGSGRAYHPPHGVLTTLTRNQAPPTEVNRGQESPSGPAIPSFLFQPNARSPVPLGNFGRAVQGESYLSLEGEHVYSSLDPPSPPSKNIQLPNGYTYQSPSPQWHPPHHAQPGKSARKSAKEAGASTVQTYLV